MPPPPRPQAPQHAAGPRRAPFLEACAGRLPSRVPVWFMRQAGRSLPEYRSARGSGSILDAVRAPALAAELTLQPVRRYGVDAAILFSDIVVPLVAVGIGIDVVPGRGPVVEAPFRGPDDVGRLRPLEPETDTPYVLDTVKMLVKDLSVPLIGFAGAPFTLASYLVEGGPSRSFTKVKKLMLSQPQVFCDLLDRLADLALASLRSQVDSGAAAVQLFDSWAGILSPADYERHVMPHSAKVLSGLGDMGVPRIHFGVGTGELLALMANAGADVVGVDWRTSLAEARRRVGPGVAVQGNLDPAACLAPWPVVEEEVSRVLEDAGPAPGHIFNLGHGVLPDTDPGILAEVVRMVHEKPPAAAAP